jgi:hypothetical protein
MSEEKDRCPLCDHGPAETFHEDKNRIYLRCDHCALIFVPARYWLSPEEEKAEYDLHQNDPGDPGYRQFLSRLAMPLLARLEPGGQGLDFGCGPGPALAEWMREHGHAMDLFDPFYYDRPEVFEKRYDFICASEVLEHLRRPRFELHRLFGLLKSNGHLGLMTKLVIDRDAFRRWHYIRDPTHICFYSRRTFAFLGKAWGARVQFVDKDVVILEKG